MRYLFPSLVFLFLLSTCGGEPAEDESTASAPTVDLVGEWIEIYPRWDERLILVLNADSTATGTFYDSISPNRPAVSGWRIGSRFMPGGFCIRYGETCSYQGFAVRGDTLFLADIPRTVLVRSSAEDRTRMYIPGASISAPAPGDSGYLR